MPILIFVLFVSSIALSKNHFIHVVGTSDKAEKNYQSFFKEADSFKEFCKLISNQGAKCTSFINLGAPGAPGQIEIEDGKPRGKKSVQAPNAPLTRKQVLDELISALKSSSPGDQVHFTLSDHGYPSIFDPSCVTISATDSICSGEIQEIIKEHKKVGVKMFVSANACFSGGFADLSEREVCTSVSASKFKSSYNAPATKFNYVNHIGSNLHDGKMIGPTFDGRSLMMGSQVILNHLCSPIRETLSKQNIPLNSKTMEKNRSNICNGDLLRTANRGQVEKIGSTLNAELRLYQKYKSAICDTAKTDETKTFCNAIEYILKNPIDANEIFIQSQAIQRKYELLDEEYRRKTDRLISEIKGRKINAALLRKYAEAKKKPEIWIGPDWKKNLFFEDLLWEAIDPQIKAMEKELSLLHKQISSHFMSEAQERDAVFKATKLPRLLESVFEINICLSLPDEKPDAEELKYLPQGIEKVVSKYFGRGEKTKFTIKDYEDAIACEKDFKY